jgi:hypothetical protein
VGATTRARRLREHRPPPANHTATELSRRHAVVKARRTKTMQGGCHGTWVIALAPRNSAAYHTVDLGAWRPARLIAAKRTHTASSHIAESSRGPAGAGPLFLPRDAGPGAGFLGRRPCHTLEPWLIPTMAI